MASASGSVKGILTIAVVGVLFAPDVIAQSSSTSESGVNPGVGLSMPEPGGSLPDANAPADAAGTGTADVPAPPLGRAANPAAPDPILPPVSTAAEAVEVTFDELDTDGDGQFTVAENESGEFFLEARFKSIDTNRDGAVDQFEFEDFQRAEAEELAP